MNFFLNMLFLIAITVLLSSCALWQVDSEEPKVNVQGAVDVTFGTHSR